MKPQYLFFVDSPELSKDVNRNLQEDFINNFNSAIETAQPKLLGNISTQTKYWQCNGW